MVACALALTNYELLGQSSVSRTLPRAFEAGAFMRFGGRLSLARWYWASGD